ncbi:hypothetical protein ACFLTD_03130 [Elusimicrobiota bacterium]
MLIKRITDRTIVKLIVWLIVLKSIFDLDWRWPFFYVGSVAMPFHRIVAFIVPVLLSFILFIRLASKKNIKVNNNIFAFLVLISISVTFISHAGLSTLNEFLRTYNFFIIFISAPYLVKSEEEFDKIIKLLLIFSLVPTFFSYLQVFKIIKFSYFDVIPYLGWIGRTTGGYHHPAGYLNFILIVIPGIIYLLLNGKISKIIFWAWVLYTLPMVIRTFHRATIILIILNTFIVIFFLRRRWIKYIIGIIFFIIIISSFKYIWMIIDQGGSITKGHFRGRGWIWEMYSSYFKQQSMVDRIVGLGNSDLPNGWNDPHSDWLRILFEYGYMGLSLYVAFLSSVFLVLLRKFLRLRVDILAGSKELFGLILVLTIILYSVTMEPLRFSSFSWGCAIILGYIYKTEIKPVLIKV